MIIEAYFHDLIIIDDGFGNDRDRYKFKEAKVIKGDKSLFIGAVLATRSKTMKKAQLQKNKKYRIKFKSMGKFNSFFPQIYYPQEVTKIDAD